MTNKFWNHYRSFNEACKKYKMNGGGVFPLPIPSL